jgi:hypothetical protein
VTTLVTVPVVTLAAAALGAGLWIVRRADNPDRGRAPVLLLALSAAASVGPFFLGSTPIFGAEKHWMPILPTLCIAGGVGLAWAGRALAAAVPPRFYRLGRWCLPAVASLAILAAASETLAAQPYALTWYNALAGGAPGGADLGMNRQFWGVSARGALPALAREAPASGTRPVYIHDVAPAAWGLYRKQGLLPASLPDAGHENSGGIARSQLAIVIHERHFNRHDYLIWQAYGTLRPIYVLRADGVPIVSVYRRP